MTTITVWLLVGYLHWGSGGTSAPESRLYPTKADCEVVLRAMMDSATHSGLRCVKTGVLKE